MRDTKQCPSQLHRPHQLQGTRPHPSGVSTRSRWPADASVPTWSQSVSRSRCTGVHASTAQQSPPTTRRGWEPRAPRRPAQARTCPPRCPELNAKPRLPRPLSRLATPSRCGHIPRRSGLVHYKKSDTLRSWAVGPALPVLRPCQGPRERCLRGPRPARVRWSWGPGRLGGHVEIGGRRSSRSDPAQVKVLRLGTTTSLGTCVSGLGFEKLHQDLSMWTVRAIPRSTLRSHLLEDHCSFRFFHSPGSAS